MRKPIQVLVYPVNADPVNAAETGWAYLLLHRLPSRGDFWQGVTGGVEEGEEVVDAARRELLEETGLVPSAMHKVDYMFSYPVAAQWRHLYADGVEVITEHVFLAQVAGRQTPMLDAREHDAWQWCGFEDALTALRWPGNIEALKRCDDFLRRRASVMRK